VAFFVRGHGGDKPRRSPGFDKLREQPLAGFRRKKAAWRYSRMLESVGLYFPRASE
jgi:hypothetical protein